MDALQIQTLLSKKFSDDFREIKERLESMPKLFKLQNDPAVMREYRDTLLKFNAFVKQLNLFLNMMEANIAD